MITVTRRARTCTVETLDEGLKVAIRLRGKKWQIGSKFIRLHSLRPF